MSERFKKALFDLENTDWAASFDDAAQCVLDEYVLSAPNMGEKNFESFCRAFSQYVIHSSNAEFNSAEIALARRCQEKNIPAPELFDEVRQTVFSGDAFGTKKIISSIGHTFPYGLSVSQKFSDKFEKFLVRQIQNHDFTNSELNELNNTLAQEYSNPKLSDLFSRCSLLIKQTHLQKIKRDIAMLNHWAFSFKSEDLLKKLSFRNTYLNLSYELLVRQHGIKNIDPESYYRKHRFHIQQAVKDLTGKYDRTGKLICRKYAINKVYKATAENDTFKLESVFQALKKYENETFFEDCNAILKALEGGRKYREVKIPQKPFIWRER